MPLVAYGLLLTGVAAGLLPRTANMHAYGMQPLAALLFFAGSLYGAGAQLVRPLMAVRGTTAATTVTW